LPTACLAVVIKPAKPFVISLGLYTTTFLVQRRQSMVARFCSFQFNWEFFQWSNDIFQSAMLNTAGCSGEVLRLELVIYICISVESSMRLFGFVLSMD